MRTPDNDMSLLDLSYRNVARQGRRTRREHAQRTRTRRAQARLPRSRTPLSSPWQANNPDGQVFSRDLASEPVPHLTAERFAAFRVRGNKSGRWTQSQRKHLLPYGLVS